LTPAKRYFDIRIFRVEEGLGNACLVKLPDDTFGVIDWGTQRSEAIQNLLDIVGSSEVAFIAASHAHEDHTLGIPQVLREFLQRGIKVKKLVYPASSINLRNNSLTIARSLVSEHNKVVHKTEIEMSAVSYCLEPGPEGIQPPKCLAFGAG
jgi:ribonuclease BN (tRNA processing enzyme)